MRLGKLNAQMSLFDAAKPFANKTKNRQLLYSKKIETYQKNRSNHSLSKI